MVGVGTSFWESVERRAIDGGRLFNYSKFDKKGGPTIGLSILL